MVFAIILLILFFVFILYRLLSFNDVEEEQKRKEKAEQRKQQAFETYSNKFANLTARLGECTMKITLNYSKMKSIQNEVLVFETAQKIILNANEYNFADILGYSIVDDSTNETITTSEGKATTSTGSMLGRAVVGGVLMGGLGAVAGAATASKNVKSDATGLTKTKHNYKFYINVNSLQQPTVSLSVGSNTDRAQELAGVLNIILQRNKQ